MLIINGLELIFVHHLFECNEIRLLLLSGGINRKKQ